MFKSVCKCQTSSTSCQWERWLFFQVGKEKGEPKEEASIRAVTIPLTEWNERKEQYKRILAFLSQNIGKSPHDQVGDEMLTPNPEMGKKRKEVLDDSCESDESVEPDYDDQIDLMINCSQTKKDQTYRKSDLEQPSENEMTETEWDFDVAEKLGPEVAETIAKLVDGTMAKGQRSDDKFKEKMDRYARPKSLKVVVPKVNPEVWSVLDHWPQNPELPESVVHSKLMHLQTFGKQFSQVTPPKLGVADSIALIQKTNHDLSMDRREKILNAQLNKKYRKLGSAGVPIADMLFGNDLKAVFANIDKHQKWA